MFKYDTVHGRLKGVANADADEQCAVDQQCADILRVNGSRVSVFNKKNPAEIPWGAAGADYVVESTGGALRVRRLGLLRWSDMHSACSLHHGGEGVSAPRRGREEGDHQRSIRRRADVCHGRE